MEGLLKIYSHAPELVNCLTCIYYVAQATTISDSTDRGEPLHHRVSTIKGASMVHQYEGEDRVGCRAPLSCSVQHPDVPHDILGLKYSQTYIIQRIVWCIYTYSTNKYSRVAEHSPDKSAAHSSSYAESESAYRKSAERHFYDVRSHNHRHRLNRLSSAGARPPSVICGETACVPLWRIPVLSSAHLRHAHRTELSGQLYHLYPLQQTIPQRAH